MADMPTASQVAANTRTWQTWLNSARNPRTARPLVVDGRWGPLTLAAYQAWHEWFNRTPAGVQGTNGPFQGRAPLALVWQNVPIPRPTPPGPPRHPNPLPPIFPGGGAMDKPPIWKEPWFWFTAAAAFVLISAFRSKKKKR